MRLLAVADIHGSMRVYRWLAQLAAGGADLLILGGDLLTAGFEEEQAREAESIVDFLMAISVPVIYIMGNDDNVDLGCENHHLRSVHGRRLDFGDYGLLVISMVRRL